MEIVIRPATPAEHDSVARLTVAAYAADGQLSSDTGYEHTLADVAGRAETGEVLIAVDPSGAIMGAVTFVLPGTAYAQMASTGRGGVPHAGRGSERAGSGRR